MSLFQAIVLAIVQGLTEFLPVSSSAHLILIPKLLHWPDQGLAFDVALHAGTLIAVSYTHLDVYKRQARYSLASFNMTFALTFFCLPIALFCGSSSGSSPDGSPGPFRAAAGLVALQMLSLGSSAL